MKTLKKISLKGISKILSEKELKNVLGGGGGTCFECAGYSGHYKCTSGDCLEWLGEHCPAGWMQWDC